MGLRRAGRLYQEKSNLEELPGTQWEPAEQVAGWNIRGVDGLLIERGVISWVSGLSWSRQWATAPTVHPSQLLGSLYSKLVSQSLDGPSHASGEIQPGLVSRAGGCSYILDNRI